MADINGDGRLDAVVGFEAISRPGDVLWYEQGATAAPGTEHRIATVIGPLSLDVADMDGDGDLEIVSIGWGHHTVLFYGYRTGRCPAKH